LIDFYTIYRESDVEGQYEKVGTVKYQDISVYEDMAADPMEQSWSYKISATDYCGVETASSKAHRTLHLQKNQGMSDEINLTWNAYEGVEYSTYCVLRETKVNDYVFIDTLTTLPTSVSAYTDLVPTVGVSNYYVGVKLAETVDPKGFLKIESGPFSVVLSNIAEAKMADSIDEEAADAVRVYTVDGTLMVDNAGDQPVRVVDALGRVWYYGEPAPVQLPSGVYVVTVGGVPSKIVVK